MKMLFEDEFLYILFRCLLSCICTANQYGQIDFGLPTYACFVIGMPPQTPAIPSSAHA